MLEAMATGCLIVGSKTQPVEEVIKDKKNGYLVNFYDIEEFVKQLMRSWNLKLSIIAFTMIKIKR